MFYIIYNVKMCVINFRHVDKAERFARLRHFNPDS